MGDFSKDVYSSFLAWYSLSTKWGQEVPYNRYCPGQYAGCVIVAVAQILARFQTIGDLYQSITVLNPGGLYGLGGGSSPNWERILDDCSRTGGKLNNSTPESTDEVARLMRYLGIALRAEYEKSVTLANSENTIEWINNWTRLNATELKAFNTDEVLNAAPWFSKKLVYMSGYAAKKTFLGISTSAYTEGHAWVIDGAFSAVRKSDKQWVNLLHCNWGWEGRDNGYFLAGVFDSQNPAIYDWELTKGTKYYYKYKIEYSIIEDPLLSNP